MNERVICPKCKGHDIQEGTRAKPEPSSEVSMDDLPKIRPHKQFITSVIRHTEHFAKCRGCGYEVTWLEQKCS